jgi:hypothetical protein
VQSMSPAVAATTIAPAAVAVGTADVVRVVGLSSVVKAADTTVAWNGSSISALALRTGLPVSAPRDSRRDYDDDADRDDRGRW